MHNIGNHGGEPYRRLAVATIFLALTLLPTFGQASSGGKRQQTRATRSRNGDAKSSADAAALVRAVVEHELNDTGEDVHWMYKLRKISPSGAKTSQMVETKDVLVSRTLLINGKELTPAQRAADDKRLEKLASDPGEQRRKQEEQKKDADQARRMFQELSDAFIYEYPNGSDVKGRPSGKSRSIKLIFHPNLNFKPKSRESRVFAAMEGTIWLNPVEKRLVRLDGFLNSDVNFGGGLLGHLDKGGKFSLQQSKIGEDQWNMASLNVDFRGKALLFKTLTLKEKQTLSDFQKVPNGLTVPQGIELLKKNTAGARPAEGAPPAQ